MYETINNEAANQHCHQVKFSTSLQPLATAEQRTDTSNHPVRLATELGPTPPQRHQPSHRTAKPPTPPPTPATKDRNNYEEVYNYRDLQGQSVCASTSVHVCESSSVSRPPIYSPHSTATSSTAASTQHNQHSHFVEQSAACLHPQQHSHFQQSSLPQVSSTSDSNKKATPQRREYEPTPVDGIHLSLSDLSQLIRFDVDLLPNAKITPEMSDPYSDNYSAGYEVESWIKRMLRIGKLSRAAPSDISVYTYHYAVKKEHSSDVRIVGNFKPLNAITMQHPGIAKDPLQLAYYMAQFKWKAKIDLTAGFYSTIAKPSCRHLLGISAPSGTYVYNVMPMGVRNGPSYFSIFIPQLLSILPKKWHQNVRSFQDDIIIGAETPELVTEITTAIVRLLTSIGASVNIAKSQMQPQQQIQALGYQLLAPGLVTVPELKREATAHDICKAISRPSATKRQRAKLLGAIIYASLRDRQIKEKMKPLYRIMNCIRMWTDEHHWLPLEIEVYATIARWLRCGGPNTRQRTTTPGQRPCGVRQVVFTDASDTMAAATFNNNNYSWKLRAPPSASSTFKEITAIVQTAQNLRSTLPQSLLWYTDNKAAETILNTRKTRSPAIHRLLLLLLPELRGKDWEWRFIGGARNLADAASRGISPEEATEKAHIKAFYREQNQKAQREITHKRRIQLFGANAM